MSRDQISTSGQVADFYHRAMRARRRLMQFLASLAVVVTLAGCSPVSQVAARLNADGTLDFGVCDARDLDEFEAYWVTEGELGATVTTPVSGGVSFGDVFRLGVEAPTDADQYLSILGIGDGRTVLRGHFEVEDLAPGEWAWNQSGVFVGTVDVAHCELNEGDVRVSE